MRALIFYTGKEELTAAALLRIKKRTGGRCFVLPQRADFVAEAERIVTSFEEAAAMSEVPAPKRAMVRALLRRLEADPGDGREGGAQLGHRVREGVV